MRSFLAAGRQRRRRPACGVASRRHQQPAGRRASSVGGRAVAERVCNFTPSTSSRVVRSSVHQCSAGTECLLYNTFYHHNTTRSPRQQQATTTRGPADNRSPNTPQGGPADTSIPDSLADKSFPDTLQKDKQAVGSHALHCALGGRVCLASQRVATSLVRQTQGAWAGGVVCTQGEPLSPRHNTQRTTAGSQKRPRVPSVDIARSRGPRTSRELAFCSLRTCAKSHYGRRLFVVVELFVRPKRTQDLHLGPGQCRQDDAYVPDDPWPSGRDCTNSRVQHGVLYVQEPALPAVGCRRPGFSACKLDILFGQHRRGRVCL